MKKTLLNAIAVFCIIAFSQLKVSAQSTILMCQTTSTSDSVGTLYDSGGPSATGLYMDDEDCQLLIQPSCADSIVLTFSYYSTEPNYDYFYIYDGTTINDPLVATLNGRAGGPDHPGTTMPASYVCLSGSMLIVWHSDFTVTDTGWAATWRAHILPSIAPAAAFSMSSLTPPLNVGMQFTDESTGGTTGWLWDFGDGDTARSQNPVHAYSAPGQYTVTFIAFQCSESDTITQTITVQGAPEIDVDPLTGFTANAQCGDSVAFPLDISNIAGGQLVYNAGGSNVGAIRVLAMKYGADQFAEYPRTITAIDQFFTNYTLTSTNTTDPGVLSGLLVGKNVLLIPEQETGSPAVWTTMGPVIRQFLNNGGSVIWCGSYSSEADCMFNTGVWSGTFSSNIDGQDVTVLLPAEPLAAGLPGVTFNAPSAAYTMNFTNPDKITVMKSQASEDVVAYHYFGAGKAIFVGFDYFDSNAETQRIIANAIDWGGENALPQWIHLSQTTDTVNAGATSTITVTFQTTGLPAGTYYANIGISSNDPNNPLVNVPCTLTVAGDPILALSSNCLALGSVMQNLDAVDTFRIINNGCDTLFLDSIYLSTADFTLSPNIAPFLLPGAYADVPVTFNSPNLGNYSDTIRLFTNDVDSTICLSATAVPAPVVSPSVSSISQPIHACGTTETMTFYIKNTGVTGGVPLTFTIGTLPAWATPSLTSGSINSGDSVAVTITFNSTGLSGGAIPSNIMISSNDPVSPNKSVSMTLDVDFTPCLDYSFVSNTCNGFSDFTVSGINLPSNYHWDFGDSQTDTAAAPSHGFPTNGTFTVTLIGCNGALCDTVVDTVNAVITGPKATNCYPTTTAYCCGIGITLFQVSDAGGFRFNNPSNDAIDGYADYTCTDFATLSTNYPYAMNISTGFTYTEVVKIWLDMNNDGVLDTVNEQLYNLDALVNHTGTMTIPALGSNVYGEPLRMRVASDYTGNPSPTPCLDLQFGQVEDYSVFLSFYDGVDVVSRETGFNVYPNPFSQSTSIEYSLKNSSKVSVEVFDVLGTKVSGFALNEIQSSGKHSYQFNNQSSGVYFVKITVDGKTSVKKVVKM